MENLILTIVKAVASQLDLKAGIAIFFGAGFGAIAKHYWPDNTQTKAIIDETPEETIRRIARTEMIDPDLAVRVAKCESGLNPIAVHGNQDGSYDHGIFQINDKYHPEVTMSQAFDVEFSTRFFCKAFKNGNLKWWSASKTCWNR